MRPGTVFLFRLLLRPVFLALPHFQLYIIRISQSALFNRFPCYFGVNSRDITLSRYERPIDISVWPMHRPDSFRVHIQNKQW